MDHQLPVPVALFIFNRPLVTARVFERIRAARPRRVLIVADGPRIAEPHDATLCAAARKIATSLDWPCELLTNFADENLGCRRRVSSGLDWVFQQCSEAIILEDDCLPHSSFFGFCAEVLRRYSEDARIMHVSGDNFQDGRVRGNASYFFSRYSLSWGWATWSRAWRYYDVNLSLWPVALKEGWLESILDDPLEIRHWADIFDRLYRGEIDTWDYQWLFACWCQGGLSIQPNENLVSNIGFGPDATHFKQRHSTLGIPARDLVKCIHPTAIIRNREADRFTFKEHIASKQSRSLPRRIAGSLSLKKVIKRLLQRARASSLECSRL